MSFRAHVCSSSIVCTRLRCGDEDSGWPSGLTPVATKAELMLHAVADVHVKATSRGASAPLRCRAGPAPPIELIVVFTSVVLFLPSWRSVRWSKRSWFLLVVLNVFALFAASATMWTLADPDSTLFVDGATQGRCFHRGSPSSRRQRCR